MERSGRGKLSRGKTIALGFFMIILAGALLLMSPLASRSGESMRFIDALFTATSATCVTGLVVVDTYTHFNLFGQLVILLLIQVGGFGFMTISVFMAMMLRKKIGLRQREMIHESINTISVAGAVRLTRKIVLGTFLFEGVGAVLLSIRFVPQMGLGRGIYYGIFHSVSAFCNAGFDLMGKDGPYSSLTAYYGDPLVNLTVMSLIVIGGLGFIVWDDLYKNRLHFKSYLLHTKIVLTVTAVLLAGGAVLFFGLEYHHLMAGMGLKDRLLCSAFNSVTARTAGFNTMDTGALSEGSRIVTTFLMFVGGSPGSTAGGIKTTTLAVIILELVQGLKKTHGSNVFHRRLEDDAIRKASMVICINFSLILSGTLLICAMHPFDLSAVLLEVTSAMSTVGMSTGITRDMNDIARVALSMLMYCGRIGSLSFALMFAEGRKTLPVKQPVEKIAIG